MFRGKRFIEIVSYTDHLYDKQGHLTQALLHKNEPLRWFWTCFPRVSKLSICDLCMKIVLWYVSYREVSIMIFIISWGNCIVTALNMFKICVRLTQWGDYNKYPKRMFLEVSTTMSCCMISNLTVSSWAKVSCQSNYCYNKFCCCIEWCKLEGSLPYLNRAAKIKCTRPNRWKEQFDQSALLAIEQALFGHKTR